MATSEDFDTILSSDLLPTHTIAVEASIAMLCLISDSALLGFTLSATVTHFL